MTAHKHTADKVRYIVCWVPTKAVEAKCLAAGMKEGDGTSFWDWIEPHDCEEREPKRAFSDAVFMAKAVLPFDVFGEVRVERQDLLNDHDDLGNVFASKSWEETAVWHVHDKTDSPTEDAPDYRAAA